MKKLLLFMIGTSLAFSAYGQSNLSPCPKIDYSKNSDVGLDGRTGKWHNCWGRYKAEFTDGFIGDVLEGEWRNGLLNGQGTYTKANGNGNKYVGEFKDGNYNGQGSSFNNGESYVGEYKDNKYNGQGAVILPNGDKYVGEYKDNKRNGQGTYTFADGRVVEGVWADNQFVRAEKINLSNQQSDLALNEERRRLEASQNTQSNLPPCPKVDYSKNTHVGVNGRTGKWHNCFGRYRAELNDANKGDVAEGEWRNGELNGQGTHYYLADNKFKGDKYVGEYKDGKSHGQGTYTYANGGKYVGEFKDNLRNGQGANTYANGDKYVGEYKDGAINGQGTYYFLANNQNKGDKYVGDHKDGQRNGQGTYTFADGRVQEGIWADSQFVRAEKINPPSQKTDLALNEERRRLEADRQAVAEDRRRLDEEKRNREQARSSQRINLDVTHTPPDAEGDFTISIQANTDTASVKINGEELGGREDGKYTVRKVARAGKETIFTITAKDLNGNTDSKRITVSRGIVESSVKFAALNPAQVKRQPARDAVAIIIGIADYTNLPKAEYANDDARAFYDYAIRGLGVKAENIKLLIDNDADEIAIYQAFKTWLPSRVRSTTDVYVYYSGHGLPAADGQGLYLLPLGAHRDLIEKTAISQQELNGYLQLAKPKSVTIFLDSCYSGLTRTGQTLVASARPLSLKAETKIFPPNFTVISASQSDQISSSSPDLQHGIFSYFLMKGMEGDADANRDGKITLGEMLEYLTEQVARQASMVSRKQQPQLLGDANKVLVGQR